MVFAGALLRCTAIERQLLRELGLEAVEEPAASCERAQLEASVEMAPAEEFFSSVVDAFGILHR